MGSKFARLACGTKRKVRAAAPWERAGIESPPVAARPPAPANPFNSVLRSIEFSQSRVVMAVAPISFAEGSAPDETKRASQTNGDQPHLHANGMPVRPAGSAANIRSEKNFRTINLNLRPGLACELFEFRRLIRVPPTTANDDAFGHDLAVADQVLADDVNVVELALLDRDEGGVSYTPRLEAAELETPQRHRRIDRRSRDHIRERHVHAQELRHGSHLIKGRAVDAQNMDVRGDGVGIEAVGEHRPRGLEGE